MMWIPTKLWTEHWATLRSQKEGNPPMKADRRALIGIPSGAGIATAIWPPDNVGVILDGTAIITALLFGLLVHVFTLGLSASADHRIRDTWVMDLIDQLRINTAYAITIGIVAVIFLSAAGAYQYSPRWVESPLGSIGIAFVVHMLMTLGMVVKRTNTAYTEMRKRSHVRQSPK